MLVGTALKAPNEKVITGLSRSLMQVSLNHTSTFVWTEGRTGPAHPWVLHNLHPVSVFVPIPCFVQA